jgi:hypothetical protein
MRHCRLFATNPVNCRTARPPPQTLSKGACHVPRRRGQGEGELIGRQAHKKIKQALLPARQLFLINFNLHAHHFTRPGWTNTVQPKLFLPIILPMNEMPIGSGAAAVHSINPNGIESFSPVLRGTSYPGWKV